MAQQLSPLNDFARVSSSVPNTGVRWFTTPYNSFSRGSSALFLSPPAVAHTWHAHIQMHLEFLKS